MRSVADLVDSPAAAARLAGWVRDPDRTRPIICVTVPTWASQPLLDVAALERELPESAVEVYVVPTGDATWELTRQLPTGLDVYGGAVRLWWPGLHEASDYRDHPLFFIHSASETPAVVERVLDALERGGVVERQGLPVGSEHGAVVTRVLPDGAELTLVDRTPAYAHRSHLSRHNLAPERVVRVGQAVRVRVGHRVPGRRRVMVSLLPFEPDPWRRLTEEYPVGTVVEAVVTKLRNIGAFVEILPGQAGLLHKSKLPPGTSHPEEVLSVGQRIAVRIERYEEVVRAGEPERRISVSTVDDDAAGSAVAASIFPDGPPWLAPVVEAAGPPPRHLPGGPARPAIPVPIPRSAPAPPAGTPLAKPSVDEAARPPAGAAPAATAARVDRADRAEASGADTPGGDTAGAAGSDAGPPGTDASGAEATEVERLEEVVARARAVRASVRGMLDDTERHLARLRGEAARIRRQLEQELGEVRRRIMELVESESAQLIGSTQAALDEARAEADELREQLAAAESDRHRLLERLQELAERAERAEHAASEARRELRREQAVVRDLRACVHRLDPDGHQRLRADIHEAWQRLTTPADRRRYPWREPRFGPDFAASLRRVHGVDRRRLAEVCAEVVCGRAAERAGLELHPLRVSEGGDAPQVVRGDGAKAFRVALQVHSPSARRLHYWLLPDGQVEFAKVVYHDDVSI